MPSSARQADLVLPAFAEATAGRRSAARGGWHVGLRREVEVSLPGGVLEQLFVERRKRVAEADDLKTVAVAHEPHLQLAAARPVGRDLLKAREAGNLVVGPVNALRPAPRSRKKRLPHCRRLVVRDLLGVPEIANVEYPQARILKPARE